MNSPASFIVLLALIGTLLSFTAGYHYGWEHAESATKLKEQVTTSSPTISWTQTPSTLIQRDPGIVTRDRGIIIRRPEEMEIRLTDGKLQYLIDGAEVSQATADQWLIRYFRGGR